MRAAKLIPLTVLCALTLSCGSQEGAPGRSEASDTPPFVGMGSQALTREGEVLVIEGGIGNVTQVGPGLFSLTEENIEAILREVYAEVPDVFDTVLVFSTFNDTARIGIAQTFNVNNVVEGLGLEVANNREDFGLPRIGGRLSSLSIMNSLLMWGSGSLAGLDAPDSFFRGVLAEEIARRWLLHVQFIDITGNPSRNLLGRGERNWSRLAQADGSYLDGNRWVDNGDDTFTNTGSDLGFAPLDLYLMGFRGAETVPPVFYISNATNQNGDPLDSTSLIAEDATINGQRVDVDIDQILNAIGPRSPPPLTRVPYDRAIVVLVTAPGQARNEWADQLQVLQNLVETFPGTWADLTGGALCMKSSERCSEPVIGLSDFDFADDNDNLVGPGDQSRLTLTLQNGGLGTADGVQVELRPVGTAVQVDRSALTAPPVPSGQRVPMDSSFELTVSSTVGCGDRLLFDVVFTTAEGPAFQERFQVEVGSRELAFDPLNEEVFWTVDPDGRDTAANGQWALGEPEQVNLPNGDVGQPPEDHSTGESRLAFMTNPQAGVTFSSNDLDGGFTTLESPIFALGNTRDPSLVFFAWRQGRNFVAGSNGPSIDDSPLIVEVSNDGGASYVELGRFSENTEEWTRVSYRIRTVIEPTNRMRFRFIASEEDPGVPVDLFVEMGVDDIQLIDSLEACAGGPLPGTDAGVMDAMAPPTMGGAAPEEEDDGCGCSATSDRGSVAGVVGVLVMMLLLRRRRDD